MTLRPELETICSWIQPGSRVLDLGCGDGTLLKHLRESRQVNGYGLEIDSANIERCFEAGINVIQTDLDVGLSDFDEESFDYVVMTQTLQAVHYPDRLIEEMMRIGREGIVTFPNFGHLSIRLQLIFGGTMPVSRTLPNEWYNTPNIHLCTLKDFENLCLEKGIKILQRTVVDPTHRTTLGARYFPNLLGEIAIYRFCRK
ncbi:MAG: methionine biosynthesis protein MetW [Gammaproteobacteria bacterium RBG_16_57_12]|nr:MAG: methionine biosynthesis protein MetW [Gammaproteobacteria bacterium RBG_16_57_12]